MIDSIRILTGFSELVEVYATDTSGLALTGLTDLFLRIRRRSDGLYLDWADDTFKSSGWTTLNGALTEVDVTNAAGLYSRVFDTSLIVSKALDDTYTVIPIQTPGTDARLTDPMQIKEGSFIDDIVSDRTHMSVSYDDQITDVDMTVWLVRNGKVVTTGLTNATVTWRNPDGTQLFQSTTSTFNSQGVARMQQTQTLVNNEPYYAEVAVNDGVGTVTTQIGVPFQA